MHDRTRGGVLQELLLLGIQMVLHAKCRQRRFVKARQDELLLARIGIDVAHGKDTGDAGLELLAVDFQSFAVELEFPLRDRSQLGVQTEEGEQLIGLESVQRAIGPFDLNTRSIPPSASRPWANPSM